jgi:hypothetical protein
MRGTSRTSRAGCRPNNSRARRPKGPWRAADRSTLCCMTPSRKSPAIAPRRNATSCERRHVAPDQVRSLCCRRKKSPGCARAVFWSTPTPSRPSDRRLVCRRRRRDPNDAIHRLRVRANNAEAAGQAGLAADLRGAIVVIERLLLEARFVRRPMAPAK